MKITTLILDCDGVLTDGTCYYGPDGECWLRFSRIDGHGIAKLRNTGVAIHVVTASTDAAIEHRCRDLRIHCHLGVDDKLAYVRDVIRCDLSTTAAMGDDEMDLPLLLACAIGAIPDEAHIHWNDHDNNHLYADALGGIDAVRWFCEELIRENRDADPDADG